MHLWEIINEMAAGADEGWGKSYYHVMPKLIKEKGLKVGAEIGVAYGSHSVAMIQAGVEKLFAVDPYQHDVNGTDGYNLPDGKLFGQEEYEQLYLHALHKIRATGNPFDLIRMPSAEAWSLVRVPLDFVFIDAKHTYEALFHDIFVWKERVRKGGIIAGHDYDHPSYPGIKKAVNEHFKKVHVEDGNVWWTTKR
jgi:hypothetical protein